MPGLSVKHCLTHLEVVLHAAMVHFPMADAMKAMKDEQRIFILSSNSVFVLCHGCLELSTSWAHVNVGAV